MSCYQSDDSRHSHQRTDVSQILIQPWCHLYSRKTTSNREQHLAATQTILVPIVIRYQWLQPFVACCTEMNQFILKFFLFFFFFFFFLFFNYAISIEITFLKFIRRIVKGFLEVLHKCIYLTSCILTYSPIIYYCDQLSFTAPVLPKSELSVW